MLKKNRYSNFVIVVVVIVIVLTMFIMPRNYFRRPLRGRVLSCITWFRAAHVLILDTPFLFLYARYHLLYNAPRLIESIVYG